MLSETNETCARYRDRVPGWLQVSWSRRNVAEKNSTGRGWLLVRGQRRVWTVPWSSKGTAWHASSSHGWWGSLRTVLSTALCARKAKGTLAHMEKSIYLLLQLLCVLERKRSKLQGFMLFASVPDSWRTRLALSYRNRIFCCGGGTRKVHA